MEQKNLYTAIGRLERETNGCGRSCPVIRLGGQPYMVDMQELVVWTALNWRISKWEDISFQCDKLASSMGGAVSRPWDDCVNRLLRLLRGAVASFETYLAVCPDLPIAHPRLLFFVTPFP